MHPPLDSGPKAGREPASAIFLKGLIEACCLMAAVAVPLVYDPHGWAGFQVVKSSIFRSAGIIVAAALFLRWWSWGRFLPLDSGAFRRGPGRWLAIAALLLAAGQILSQLASLQPWTSFWGLPQIPGGTMTFFCGLSLCLGAALTFREAAARERLLMAVLWPSLPLSLYALLQYLKADPLLFEESQTIVSFAGHPIYLAGYLVMLMPLCFCLAVRSIRSVRDSKSPVLSRLMAVAYGTLLILQFAAFVSAEKRGPWVALLAAVTIAGTLWAAYQRSRRLFAVSAFVAAAAFLVLAGLGLMRQANWIPPGTPVLDKLSQIVSSKVADPYRSGIWGKAAAIASSPEQSLSLDKADPLPHGLRLLLGYGNQTLQDLVLKQSEWYGFTQDSFSDYSYHNLFWDLLQNNGVFMLAVAVFFFLMLANTVQPVFGTGTWRFPWVLTAFALAGAGAGTALLAALHGPGFAGLGFQLGLVAGTTLGIAGPALRSREGPPDRAKSGPVFLRLALLVALLAHGVDMAFVFQSGNTMVLFWLFAGWIWALGNDPGGISSAPEAGPAGSRRTMPSWIFSALVGGLLVGTMLVIMLHAFVQGIPGRLMEWPDLVRQALMLRKGSGLPSALLPALLLPTWLLAGFAITTSLQLAGEPRFWKQSCLLSLGISAVCAAGYLGLKTMALFGIGAPDEFISVSAILAQAGRVGSLSSGFFLVLIGLMGALALVLFFRKGFIRPGRMPISGAILWTLVWGLAAIAMIPSAWTPLRMQASGAWGRMLELSGRLEAARLVYFHVLAVSPHDFVIQINASQTLVKDALGSRDRETFGERFKQAESVLLQAMAHEPRYLLYYHLGNLYLQWASATQDPEERIRLATAGLASYDRCIHLIPVFEAAYFEASILAGGILGDTQRSASYRKEANQLASQGGAALGADRYFSGSVTTPIPSLKKAYIARSLELYDLALAAIPAGSPDPKLRADRFRFLMAQGTLYRNEKNFARAADCFRDAIKAGGGPDQWKAQAMMAHVSSDLGQWQEAIAHLESAIPSAPANLRRDLEQFRAALQQKAGSSPSTAGPGR